MSALIIGWFFFAVALFCSFKGESQIVVYSFCILANIWWAVDYIARDRP